MIFNSVKWNKLDVQKKNHQKEIKIVIINKCNKLEKIN